MLCECRFVREKGKDKKTKVMETSSADIKMREEFGDTAPHYGGKKVWDALRAAEEEELSLAQTIIESAGSKYELPKYVLRDPSNLITTK
ncbi:hypothetical protein N665_0039s0014 [Sinapis alba]|nr:hypothetical protein N665_0039s0014 [Sinapis alba]